MQKKKNNFFLIEKHWIFLNSVITGKLSIYKKSVSLLQLTQRIVSS